jgi:ABC-type dipeptide/oligopeptide/nickel transport system permease subunit
MKWLRFWKAAMFVACAYLALSFLAIFIAPYPQGSMQPLYEGGKPGDPWSWQHPLGINSAGYDVFSETLFAIRGTILWAISVVLILALLGVLMTYRQKKRSMPKLENWVH